MNVAFRSDAPRALITGLGGFTGRYLAQLLETSGYSVFGTAHGNEPTSEQVFAVDLLDRVRVERLVQEVQPDVVAHLAAISFVAHGDVDAIYRVNVVGTRNLLESLAGLEKKPAAVLLASSANVYGNSTAGVLDESIIPAPANDYAVSKLAMEYMARLWMGRLPIVITRPFNYTGVGQGTQFLLPKIVGHFKRGERLIELGNLDVERDFSDVRFVAKVYAGLLEKAPLSEIFNVCSGAAYSLNDILRMMTEIAGYEIEVRVNPEFVRANEVKCLRGDPCRLRSEFPSLECIPLLETLRWMYAEETH